MSSEAKCVHFIGVGGVGMSGIARVASDLGMKVSGSDMKASRYTQQLEEAGIPVFEPRTLRDEDELSRLRDLAPDAICVAAYGKILPQEVLDIPEHGCLNVHASLLPKYRGAAPIERAILAGEREAGVCIMHMEAGTTASAGRAKSAT